MPYAAVLIANPSKISEPDQETLFAVVASEKREGIEERLSQYRGLRGGVEEFDHAAIFDDDVVTVEDLGRGRAKIIAAARALDTRTKPVLDGRKKLPRAHQKPRCLLRATPATMRAALGRVRAEAAEQQAARAESSGEEGGRQLFISNRPVRRKKLKLAALHATWLCNGKVYVCETCPFRAELPGFLSRRYQRSMAGWSGVGL
jgi:hypothetical protein